MEAVQTAQASARSIQLASILRAQYSSGKVSLPVSGALYARFKHVQGIPSSSQNGYSLTKLQMIDLMVERLTALQGDGFSAPTVSRDNDSATVMTDLATQLQSALGEPDSLRQKFSPGMVQPGMLLSMYL